MTYIYKYILDLLSHIFNLMISERVIERPNGIKYWGYSDTSDTVYEICISFKDGYLNSFVFVHGDSLGSAYLKAIMNIVSRLFRLNMKKFKKFLKGEE